MGFISPEYQSDTYFDVNYNENMLGLAPSIVHADDDQSIINRQFLYTFVNSQGQKDKGLLESYSFNGGELFLVGGTQDDYEQENTQKGYADSGVGFTNKGVTKTAALKETPED